MQREKLVLSFRRISRVSRCSFSLEYVNEQGAVFRSSLGKGNVTRREKPAAQLRKSLEISTRSWVDRSICAMPALLTHCYFPLKRDLFARHNDRDRTRFLRRCLFLTYPTIFETRRRERNTIDQSTVGRSQSQYLNSVCATCWQLPSFSSYYHFKLDFFWLLQIGASVGRSAHAKLFTALENFTEEGESEQKDLIKCKS